MTPGEAIVISLSGEPVGKARPRFVRKTGMAFTAAKTRNYEAALRMAGEQAMDGRPPIAGPVSVVVEAVFSVPVSWSGKKRAAALAGTIFPTKRPDWENVAKTLDGFNGVVWVDDAQVVNGQVIKRYGAAPFLRIAVRAAA